MVNHRIRNDLKETALRLRLWDHGWELKDICEALRVSDSEELLPLATYL